MRPGVALKPGTPVEEVYPLVMDLLPVSRVWSICLCQTLHVLWPGWRGNSSRNGASDDGGAWIWRSEVHAQHDGQGWLCSLMFLMPFAYWIFFVTSQFNDNFGWIGQGIEAEVSNARYWGGRRVRPIDYRSSGCSRGQLYRSWKFGVWSSGVRESHFPFADQCWESPTHHLSALPVSNNICTHQRQ